MIRTLVVGLLLFVVLAAGCDSGSERHSATDTETTASPVARQEVNEEPQFVAAQVGELLRIDGQPDLAVESFTRTTDGASLADDFTRLELDPGDEFLVLRLRVINDTDKPAGLNVYSDLSLLSRGEDISTATNFIIGARDGIDADVLPVGAQAVGLAVWSARQGFDQLVLQYKPGGVGRGYLIGLEGRFSTEALSALRPEDQREIEKLIDDLAEAFSDEDWARTYDMLPPSSREECPRGQYLATINIAIEFAKGFVGEDGWEALKEDARDGYEIESIEPDPRGALLYYTGNAEPVLVVQEDGEWWLLEEEDPCDFSFE